MRQGTVQFLFSAKLVIGDGSTETYFGDSDKQVVLNSGVMTGANQNFITVKTNATATFGILHGATTKVTYGGCSFYSLEATYAHYLIYSNSSTGGIGCLYSCYFSGTYIYTTVCLAKSGGCRIWNCLFAHNCYPIYSAADVDYYRVTVQNSIYGLREDNGVFENITLQKCGNSISLYTSGSRTVKNLQIIRETYIVVCWSITVDSYLINAESSLWHFNWQGTSTGKVYRQYEFDLTVTDQAGAAIQNAAVTLKDKNGNTVFSVATDAAGAIATQTVTRGYYDQAHGDALQDSSPHTLAITKAGFQTYVKKFTLTEKTKWELKLAHAVPVFSGLGQPILNLKPAEPENTVVLPL